MKFDNETMVAKRGPVMEGTRFVDKNGDLYTTMYDWGNLHGMVVTPRKHDLAWLLDVAPKNPGKEYVGSSGVRYRWDNNRYLEVWGDDKKWLGAGVSAYMLTETFEELPTAEGSPDWFAALPEGTCCWSGANRDYYARRVGPTGYDWVFVLNGETTARETKTTLCNWSLCLHNGKRAEPAVGLQFWADMLRQKGIAVRHKIMGKGVRIINNDFVYRNGPKTKAEGDWFAAPTYASGWSLWEPAAVDDAQQALAEIDEHRAAVAKIVERLKGEQS